MKRGDIVRVLGKLGIVLHAYTDAPGPSSSDEPYVEVLTFRLKHRLGRECADLFGSSRVPVRIVKSVRPATADRLRNAEQFAGTVAHWMTSAGGRRRAARRAGRITGSPCRPRHYGFDDAIDDAAAELLAADTAGAPAPIAEWARDADGRLTPDPAHRGGDTWAGLLAALGVEAESDAADEVWSELAREYAAFAAVDVLLAECEPD